MKISHIILSLILLFAFSTRLFRLSFPQTYYFDEVYHAFTALSYADNDPRGYEWWHISPEKGTAYEWLHPPVSKLVMAAGIKIFGKNSFGWRFGSAVFGTLVIYLIYALAKSLFKQKSVALLAAFLASLDGLLLVQSRIAMNDIYVTAFILAALLFYWHFFKAWPQPRPINQGLAFRPRFLLFFSGIFTGLAIATKWSGIFLLAIIAIMELIQLIKNHLRLQPKRILLLLTAYCLLPTAIYLLSYSQFFLQGHTWFQFKELHNQIIRYETTLDATHPYQSQAWQWPLLLRPIWYHVDYKTPANSNHQATVANIYALSNPFISWLGLITISWLIYKTITTKNKKIKPSCWLLITGYFCVWFPWLLSPRIMFYYHYTPAIPFLCIALAHLYSQLFSKNRTIVFTLLFLILFCFIFFFPIWTGLPTTTAHTSRFFWLKSWK